MRYILVLIEAWLAQLFNRIYESAVVTDRAISAFRIITALLILHLLLPYGGFVQLVPDALYRPEAFQLGSFFEKPPGDTYFLILEFVAIGCCLALISGFYANWAARVLAFCYLGITAVTYGFGKIDHFFLLPLTLFIASFSNWTSQYSLWRKEAGAGPLATGLLAIFLAGGMLTAGLPKLLIWVDMDLATSGFMNWFNGSYLGLEKSGPLAYWFVDIQPFYAEVLDYSAVLFELSAVICLLIGKGWWRAWIVIACLFHAGNHLLLGIDFRPHWIVYLPFAIDGLLNLGIRRLLASKMTLVLLLIYATVVAGFQVFRRSQLVDSSLGQNPYLLLSREDYTEVTLIWLVIGLGALKILMGVLVNKVAKL